MFAISSSSLNGLLAILVIMMPPDADSNLEWPEGLPKQLLETYDRERLLSYYHNGLDHGEGLDNFDFIVASDGGRRAKLPDTGIFGDDGYQLTIKTRIQHGRRVQSVFASGGVYFPPLRSGEIVPIFGHMYRVLPNKRAFLRLDTDALPKDVSVKENSIVVPLRREGLGHTVTFCSYEFSKIGDSAWFYLNSIETSADDRSSLVAVLNAPSKDINDSKIYRLKVGDEVTFWGRTFKVQNIVPRDEKQHLLGWIEFTSPQ